MVGLRPNQMKIDLKKVFVENITYFWKRKAVGNPKCAHAYTRMRMHTQAIRTRAYCMSTHARACVRN